MQIYWILVFSINHTTLYEEKLAKIPKNWSILYNFLRYQKKLHCNANIHREVKGPKKPIEFLDLTVIRYWSY